MIQRSTTQTDGKDVHLGGSMAAGEGGVNLIHCLSFTWTEIQKYTITQMHSSTLVEIGVTIWSIELLPISMNGFATCVKTKHTWILCVTKWLKRLTNQQEMPPLKSLGSHCFGAGDSILVRIVLILLRLVRHCSTGVLHCCQLVHIVLVFAVPCKLLLWRGTD